MKSTGPVRAQVAASVDLPVALMPYLSRLFEPLDALGSTPQRVVSMMRKAGVGRWDRVLDLGCGKGAVAVELAQRLGCLVHGIDAYEPFITQAGAAAEERGADLQCLFEVGDVRSWERRRVMSQYEGAMMLGLFPCHRAARLLRRWVRPGGVYVIDDAFRKAGRRAGVDGLNAAPSLEECRAAIEVDGDRIEQEFVPTPRQVRVLNDGLYRLLRKSCALLEEQRPRLRPPLREFLSRQRAANRLLAGPLRSALWLVRRPEQVQPGGAPA